jgi:hypothetical protein
MRHYEFHLVTVQACFIFIHLHTFKLALIFIYSGGWYGFCLCLPIDPTEICLASPLVETHRGKRVVVQMRSWVWVVSRQRSILNEWGRWCTVSASPDIGPCWIRSLLSVEYSLISLEWWLSYQCVWWGFLGEFGEFHFIVVICSKNIGLFYSQKKINVL